MKEAVDLAAALCVRFEGFRSAPYLCPAGVATIGVGATTYLDGRAVTLLDPPISEPAARRMLMLSLERRYLPDVLKLCPGADTPQRVAALLDFTFNLGAGSLKASTLRRCVNAGDWDAVPAQLMRWVNAGGRRLPGLVKRRAAEVALINS